jgi:DNA mismatch repair ATPase MutL
MVKQLYKEYLPIANVIVVMVLSLQRDLCDVNVTPDKRTVMVKDLDAIVE